MTKTKLNQFLFDADKSYLIDRSREEMLAIKDLPPEQQDTKLIDIIKMLTIYRGHIHGA